MYVYMYVLQIHIGMCLGILGWIRIPRFFGRGTRWWAP